jgi:hypothetical protein
VLGWCPRHDAQPLRFGSAWHLGCELYESGLPIEEAVNAVRELYEATPVPPSMELVDWLVEQETCCAMVIGHYERWGADQTLETVAVEVPFNLPLLNPTTLRQSRTYRNAGKIDRIAKMPDGRLALVERKTAKDDLDPSGDYWRRLNLDSQISRYYLAARTMGYDVQTVIYDVQRKPAIRPKAISKADRALTTSRQNYFGLYLDGECPERETPAMYGARLVSDQRERPDFYFARREIPRLESDIDEFSREHWQVIHQIASCQNEMPTWGLSAWPRNTGSCIGFGRCPYLDICRQGSTETMPDGFVKVDVVHPELSVHDDTGETA